MAIIKIENQEKYILILPIIGTLKPKFVRINDTITILENKRWRSKVLQIHIIDNNVTFFSVVTKKPKEEAFESAIFPIKYPL